MRFNASFPTNLGDRWDSLDTFFSFDDLKCISIDFLDCELVKCQIICKMGSFCVDSRLSHIGNRFLFVIVRMQKALWLSLRGKDVRIVD